MCFYLKGGLWRKCRTLDMPTPLQRQRQTDAGVPPAGEKHQGAMDRFGHSRRFTRTRRRGGSQGEPEMELSDRQTSRPPFLQGSLGIESDTVEAPSEALERIDRRRFVVWQRIVRGPKVRPRDPGHRGILAETTALDQAVFVVLSAPRLPCRTRRSSEQGLLHSGAIRAIGQLPRTDAPIRSLPLAVPLEHSNAVVSLRLK